MATTKKITKTVVPPAKKSKSESSASSEDKLYKRYFQWQSDFQMKYGPKTVVLCEVGAFFEIYGIDNSTEKIGVAEEVAKLLNIQCTLKNKKKGPGNNRQNPKMAGFQPPYLQRHLEILLANNWTVVIVEQTTTPPNPEREITYIYSPGTNINYDAKPDNNYIVSIFIESNKAFKTQMEVYILGFSAIDVSTGENTIHYFYAQKKDITTVDSELFSFIETYNPREVILNFQNIDESTKDKFIESINFTNRVKYVDTIKNADDKEIFKLAYQNQFLKKIFPETNYLDPVEYLDLDKYPATTVSYIVLLKFIHEHSPNIINKLNKPIFQIQQNTNLVLNNNTIYQLDILPGNQIETHETYKSLYHVIDMTRTPMGKRLLKYHLLNPIYNADELQHRYSLIASFQQDMPTIKTYQQLLGDVMDLERRHRKLFLGLVQPYEYAELEMSYHAITQLFKMLGDKLAADYHLSQETTKHFSEYVEEFKKIYNLDEMIKYSMKNIDGSFFNPGHYPEVDAIQSQINALETDLNNMAQTFSNAIEVGSEYVSLEKNEKEGYFFKVTTANRAALLKSSLSKETVATLSFKKQANSEITKIFLADDDKRFKTLADLKENIRGPVVTAYRHSLEQIYLKYHETLQLVSTFIAQVDLVVSHARVAITYGYSQPMINNQFEGKSYLDIKDLRHPIAERIQTKTNYIPNDVQLGCGVTGVLLFGINAAGKSCLLKSVGMAVIMAQMGMYVPASKMEFYPFQNIFTRISGNDNMFKGKSSYTIEMQEMNQILKYSNEHSLILGDEICKGTEHIAALAIVASSVQWFSKNNIKFVMATHLHQLAQMKSVTELKNVALKHLEIIYDANDDVFIYNRKLKDGSGESRYGLNVAKYIIDQPEFIKTSIEIENELLNAKPLLSTEKSNFNNKIYIDGCQICGSHDGIEQHHIIYQSTFDENGMSGHIKKDVANNLAFLCKKHHDAVHNHKLEIKGYIMTSRGPILKFRSLDLDEAFDKKKQHLKFSEEEVAIIKSMKDTKLSLRAMAFTLADKHKIRVSTTTLRKILLDIYY